MEFIDVTFVPPQLPLSIGSGGDSRLVSRAMAE